MSENNELNVYNHLETIRKAADALESIHVYEVNARSFGSSKSDELNAQIADLKNQILDYKLQLSQLQDELDKGSNTIKALIQANNKLIETNKLSVDNIELTQKQAVQMLEKYDRIPKFVKKMYGVN